MSSKYKKIALSGLFFLTACEVKPTLSVAAPDAPSAPEVNAPELVTPPAPEVESPVTPPAGPELTVFKNWGHAADQMGLDFSNSIERLGDCGARHATNCEYRIDDQRQSWFNWFTFESGFYGVDGHQDHWCVGTVTFAGTAQSGTITIAGLDMGWSFDPSEQPLFHTSNANYYCQNHDGVYAFEVTAEGLTLNGQLYTEAVDE